MLNSNKLKQRAASVAKKTKIHLKNNKKQEKQAFQTQGLPKTFPFPLLPQDVTEVFRQ